MYTNRRIILFVIFSSIFLNCSYFANADQNHNNEVVLVEDDVSSSDEDTANKKPWSAEFKLDMEGNGQTGEMFVPTKEWKLIKPGQIIPKGIHVRLNIQTGEREGKLLDQEDNNANDKIVEVKPSDASNDRNRVFSKELEDALKKLNDEKQAKSEEENSAAQANEDEKIRNKYKSYEKIKEEMEELNLNVKTDYEIMKDLILKLNSSEKLDRSEKMAVLKDLEFYVHQYDNGLLLCDMGGFNNILADLNKTEDVQISIESILVLGAAIQSHPKVKIYAIKTDLLQYILNKLSLQAESDSALEKDFNSRLIFALSGLLRNFPFAQSQFIRFGGVEIFSKLVKHSNSIKLKTKILTLIDDLIKEKNEIVENKGSVIIDNYQEKLEQYEKINLMDELMEKKWCEAYEILLNDAEDYDTREKIINSIMTLIDKCRENFRSNRNLLNNLKKFKKEFAKTVENDDNYLLNLIQNIDYILLKIDTKDEF